MSRLTGSARLIGKQPLLTTETETRLPVHDPPVSIEASTCCSAPQTIIIGVLRNERHHAEALRRQGHTHVHAASAIFAHLYQAHGDSAFGFLSGNYVAVLLDTATREVKLFRDAHGAIPLSYAYGDGNLRFSTDLRDLAYDDGRIASLSTTAVSAYLSLGYVPEPETIFRGVWKVPAGGVVTITYENGQLKHGTRALCVRSQPLGGNPMDAMAVTFSRAVARGVEADNPVVALSDGIDSALLLRCASSLRPGIRSRTIHFGWMSTQAAQIAAQTADAVRSRHQVVEVGVLDYLPLLRRSLAKQQEPIADWTMPGYAALLQAATEGAEVVLTGHGPDELFLGYDWTREAQRSLQMTVVAEPGGSVDPYSYQPEYRGVRRLLTELGRRADIRDYLPRFLISRTGCADSLLRDVLLASYSLSNGLLQLGAMSQQPNSVVMPFLDPAFVEACRKLHGASGVEERVKAPLYRLATRLGYAIETRPKRPFFPDIRALEGPLLEEYTSTVPGGIAVELTDSLRRTAVPLMDMPSSEERSHLILRLLSLETYLRGIAGSPRNMVA